MTEQDKLVVLFWPLVNGRNTLLAKRWQRNGEFIFISQLLVEKETIAF